MQIPASFRNDLKLYPGPRESDGSPTFNLYDPLNAKYYKIGWEESYIYKLAKPGMSYAAIASEVNKNSTFQLDEDDVMQFYQQCAFLGLLNIPKSSEQMMEEFQKNQGSLVWRILMNYLYFKIPLFKPDKFLARTLPYVKVLWSTPAIFIYCLATIIGVIGTLPRLEEYLHTFSYFFNFEGALMYAATICVLKVVHELAHAYTAKNYHIHVPTMGTAIIVLWPVLYTDVTDAWKLADRRQRFAISVAGVTSELVIAGVSTFGWLVSPPGIMQSIFFLLSSTTWISSVLINFNPAMRFDGYYILSDLWGIDNLRQRSFAVTRWKIHQWLFGFNTPSPEPDLSNNVIRGMCLYSFFTWAYLLTLYTIIALFVYHEFAKALGIILFMLEIALFFVWPVITECQILYRLRSNFRLNLRTIISATATTLLLLWLVLPLPRHESIPSITIPEREQVLYVVEGGQIHRIFFKHGDQIQEGETILQINKQKLNLEIDKKEEERKLLEKMIIISSLLQTERSMLPAQKAELSAVIDQLNALKASHEYLDVKAEFAGELFAFDDTLKVDQWIGKDQVIGKIADRSKVNVIAYIPGRLIHTVHKDQKVQFALPYSAKRYSGVISSIEPIPALTLDYPALGSRYHGPLAVSVDRPNQEFKLLDTYYKAKITLESNSGLPYGKIGNTIITTSSESLLMRLVRYLYAMLMQESSL